MKIAVTGANSSVGLNLLAHISNHDELSVIAAVRSEKAMASLPNSPQIDARIISYQDQDGLADTLEGVDCVVHLAGILIESKHSNYSSANVAATAAVVAAAKRAEVKYIVFISVIGAHPDSTNTYFRSKGLAEKLILDSGIGACIIRTSILLGPGTAGAEALFGMASQPNARVLGGGNYSMRPLDIDDLSKAILNSCQAQTEGATVHELAGPEPVLYRDLIRRAAKLMGGEIRLASMPIWLAKLGASISYRLKGGGITATVIDVITADEVILSNADKALGITLTPLQTTLEKILEKKKKS